MTTHRRGFTMVEVIIYLLMLGMVLGVTFPKVAAANREMTIQSAATQFRADLQRARSEAVKINGVVDVTRLSKTRYNVPGLGPRLLPAGVTFSDGSPDVVTFSSFGPVVAGAGTFRLLLGAQASEVVVTGSGHAVIR